jgi:hypothetical protein
MQQRKKELGLGLDWISKHLGWRPLDLLHRCQVYMSAS